LPHSTCAINNFPCLEPAAKPSQADDVGHWSAVKLGPQHPGILQLNKNRREANKTLTTLADRGKGHHPDCPYT